MKRITIVALTLMLAVIFAACSAAPDRQPAIEAYDKTSAAFNEAAALINENLDLVAPDLVEKCNEISGLLDQYYDLLAGDAEITQETLDNMAAWLVETEQWSIATKEEIETGLAQIG